jgi:hypothetical protein
MKSISRPIVQGTYLRIGSYVLKSFRCSIQQTSDIRHDIVHILRSGLPEGDKRENFQMFANFSVLNRNQVCRFWILRMTKIMQMEMLNVAVHRGVDASEEAIGDNSNVFFFKCSARVTWCSKHKSLFTHRLNPRGRQVLMSTTQVWGRTDNLATHTKNHRNRVSPDSIDC